MTLHQSRREVGVRELHDRLSAYLEMAEAGAEVIVTRRGKRVARLQAIGSERSLDALERRGLIRMPKRPRSRRRARVKGSGPVSDMVSEQRR